MISTHFAQLRNSGLIADVLAEYADLIGAIGAGIAAAYRHTPATVLKALESWYGDCAKNRPTRIDEKIVTKREKLLAVVALTYGYMEFIEGKEYLSAREVFDRLKTILEEEEHSFVRSAAVIAISLQAREHFEVVEPELRSVVSKVDESEQIEVINIVKGIYLKQRAEMKGGDHAIIVGARRYQVWIDTPRELTGVERSLTEWLKDANNPAAQQLAVKTFIAIANALETEEEKFIKDVLDKRKEVEVAKEKEEEPASLEESNRKRLSARVASTSNLLHDFASWCFTIDTSHAYPILKGVLPETITQHQTRTDIMDFVLEKWNRMGNQLEDRTFQIMVRRLGYALWLVEHIAFVAGGIFIVLFFLMISRICS